MNASSQPPYFLVTGLVIGLALGLLVSLLLLPVQFTDVPPAALGPAERDAYRQAVALAFRASGDLTAAAQRINFLRDDDPLAALAEQAQRLAAGGVLMDEARALAQLAAELEAAQPAATVTAPPAAAATHTAPAAASPAPTGSPSAAASLPASTATRAPTAAPTPSAQDLTSQPVTFRLVIKDLVCDPSLPQGLLQVETVDAQGRPLARVPVTLTGPEGSQTEQTGRRPEIGQGYVSFTLAPDTTYQLSAGAGSPPVEDLEAPACSNGDSRYTGGWSIRFQQ